MTIGINWKAVWKPVWKKVWKQAVIPPTPAPIQEVIPGGGKRKRRDFTREQNEDDLEVVRILTEFLSRM